MTEILKHAPAPKPAPKQKTSFASGQKNVRAVEKPKAEPEKPKK